MTLLTAVLLVLAALHVTLPVEGMQVDVASHLQHLETHRYPNSVQNETRRQVAEYIIGRFEEYGLRVDLQLLQAFAVPDPDSNTCSHGDNACLSEVEGVNVIGISGPERESVGSVVVVAAGYDTDGVGDPVHDNGAGVAVLLETARMYQTTAAARPHLATLFVAFDLSVDTYRTQTGAGGGGLPGSWSLVQDYLRSFVDQDTSRVGGAIVLGPLMNVNHENGSQWFNASLSELFPAAHKEIAAGGNRGDFLAMVTQGTGKVHRALASQVAHSHREVGGRLVELSLGNCSHKLLPPSLPPRQAAAFWGSTYKGVESPLPAILLTDTEENREWPQDSGPPTHLTESQRVFLDTTVNSLVHFLMQRQAVEDWWEVGLLVTLVASGAINLLLLLRLHRLYTPSSANNTWSEAHYPSEDLASKHAKCVGNGVASLASVQPLS